MELGELLYQRISGLSPWRAARLTALILNGPIQGVRDCLEDRAILVGRVQAGLEALNQAKREGWLAQIPYYPPLDVRRIRADRCVEGDAPVSARCGGAETPMISGAVLDEVAEGPLRGITGLGGVGGEIPGAVAAGRQSLRWAFPAVEELRSSQNGSRAVSYTHLRAHETSAHL
eukprot:322881-Alexandrium_andersonii.AAC.1